MLESIEANMAMSIEYPKSGLFSKVKPLFFDMHKNMGVTLELNPPHEMVMPVRQDTITCLYI